MSSQTSRKNENTTPSKVQHTEHKYSYLYDGKEDRKALNELLEKLPIQKSSPSTSAYKQLSLSNFYLRSPSRSKPVAETTTKVAKTPVNKKEVRRRTKKESPLKNVSSKISKQTKNNNANLTGWLSKSKDRSAENNLKKSSDGNKKKGGFKRQSSGSFAKYGIYMPSFEDIVAYQRKVEKQKQCIDSLDTMDDSQESLDLNIDEPHTPDVALNCKHLSQDDIDDSFDKNYRYISNIYHGIRYSARHERFKKGNFKDQFTVNDLKYNTSMISFTFDQKQQLLSRLHKKFNKSKELGANSQYFFKVLLPELCTKIFMDVHNMSFDEATEYLENSPV